MPTLREQVSKAMSEAIIFLKGEKRNEANRPLYTKKEIHELYSVKKDLEKFQKKDDNVIG